MGATTANGKPDLEALRARIADLERRPVLAPAMMPASEGRGDEVATFLSAPAGTLHEVFADEHRQAGVALGFTLGLARGVLAKGRQALIYLQLNAEAQEVGLPYAPGLAMFGLGPDSIVMSRVEGMAELLWALEEALACRAVAAVLVDVAGKPKALDFTASRRIALRAAAADTSAFLIRYGMEREASAAQLRWRVRPSLSAGQIYDPAAPGAPRFLIDIEKRRLSGRAADSKSTMVLDWTENGFVAARTGQQPSAPFRRRPSAPRPQPAALGDGLSQAS